MKEDNPSIRNKVVLGAQISRPLFLPVCAWVFIFLGAAVYGSVVNNDHPVHAVVLSSVVSFAFLILTSVVTIVFTTIMEGRRVSENGRLS